MSVTFFSNVRAETSTEEPCLCAQFAPGWGLGEISAELRAELAAHADPDCRLCRGKGVELAARNELSLNLCNGNAAALCGLLGLPQEYGSAPVALARRAVMRARARADVSAFTRPEETVHGAPRVHADGTVELRPIRISSMGLDSAGLVDRLERFAALVESAAAAGGTEISWG